MYVYYNVKDCKTEPRCDNQTLYGAFESRFGFSMTALGDINKDGYIDVAIGAPYEDGGAIYIYLGGKNGLNSKHSQVGKFIQDFFMCVWLCDSVYCKKQSFLLYLIFISENYFYKIFLEIGSDSKRHKNFRIFLKRRLRYGQ